MSYSMVLLLFAAGFLGGGVNALSGGGTLLTFPALLYTGLPAASAAASNAVAISPSHIFATIPDRRLLPSLSVRWCVQVAVAFLGSILGATLLVGIPQHALELLIPGLIALATGLFACAPVVQKEVEHTGAGRKQMSTAMSATLVAISSVYGGFFGAGFGMVLTAILAFTEGADLRTVKVQKNVLGSCVSVAATLTYIGQGSVDWSKTPAVFAGSVLGGYVGGLIIRYVPAHRVRILILILGVSMTAFYTWKYWI